MKAEQKKSGRSGWDDFLEYGYAARRAIERARAEQPVKFVVTVWVISIFLGVLLALYWPF